MPLDNFGIESFVKDKLKLINLPNNSANALFYQKNKNHCSCSKAENFIFSIKGKKVLAFLLLI